MDYVLSDRVLPDVLGWADELVALRREAHQNPELGFETPKTVERISSHLRAWGLDTVDTELVKGGVIAVVNGSTPGKTIALRADIDALPIDDLSGRPWASRTPGRAHACGHDGHQTWALGVGRYFAAHRDFPGRLVLIFQPSEETMTGAEAVIASGVFEKYGIREIYGGHDEPNLPKGVFGINEGPLQASSSGFWIRIRGAGTHGGRPHLGIDPLAAGATLYGALQTVISRRIDPVEPAVLSVCSVNAGRYEAYNVAPPELTMSGTVRTYSAEVRERIEAFIRQMADDAARTCGCTAEVKILFQAPPVINDPELAREGKRIATELFGEGHAVAIRPFMSSEDFARYQKLVPGVMVRVGIRDEDHTAGVHNQSFDFNDEVLPAAVTLFTQILRSRLRALA